MPIIAKHNDVVTVIFSFAVEPERQQELVVPFLSNIALLYKQLE